MLKKIINKLGSQTLIIVAVWLIIVLTNYRFGTWLTGWDNLHPEMNPTHDLWRSFNSVWQEYQGLGLLGGMAHSADLVRQIMVLILSPLLPQSIIRYLLSFSMLLVGALGIKSLWKLLFPDKNQVGGVFAALFFMLNFGTVQNFYVSFEPFYWFFGFLPWLLYSLLKIWQDGGKKNWFWWVLLNFLATPLAYVQTNFIVYGLILVAASVIFIKKVRFKKIVLTGLIVILTNLFWLLPVAYFTLSGGSDLTSNTQINKTATPEVTIENSVFANAKDILLMRSYWSTYIDYNDDTAGHLPMMSVWENNHATFYLGFLFAALMLAGVVSGIKTERRNLSFWLIIAIYLVAVLLLFIPKLPGIPIISQAFRSPFIKAVTPLTLGYSVLIGLSGQWLWGFFAGKKTKRLIIFAVLAGLLCIYILPIFSGNFIYKNLKQNIPTPYWELAEFMKTQPQAERLVVVPADVASGWQFNNWGYRGIGIWHFLFKQAVTSSAFDVWNEKNEDFHLELLNARLEQNNELFSQVLTKYGVRYILLDQSIYMPGNSERNNPQVWQQLLTATACQPVFTKEMLTVYDCGERTNSYLRVLPNYIFSNTAQKNNFYDLIYDKYGDYVAATDKTGRDEPFSYLYRREIEPYEVNYDDLGGKNLYQITLGGYHPSSNYEKIIIPGVNLDKVQPVLLSSQLTTDKIVLKLEAARGVAINDVPQANFEPVILELPLPASESSSGAFYLDVGTEAIMLDPTPQLSAQAIISLADLSYSQTWYYFFAHDAQVGANDNLEISLDNTASVVIPTSLWQPWSVPQEVAINGDVEVVSGYVIAQSITLDDILGADPINCDVLGRGSVFKEERANGRTYIADKAANLCDVFGSSSINVGQSSYLVSLKVGNKAGRSLNIELVDGKTTVPFWTTLLATPYAETTFSLPQTIKTEADGVMVNLSNRSLAGEQSHNELVSINLFTLPSEWLSDIELQGSDATSQTSALSLEKVTKFGTSHYTAEIINQGGGGVLELGQSFNSGWRATINGKSLTQVKINNWSNGWLISDELCPGECEIKIVFWPQWLGWLGLAISGLSLTGAVIVILSRKNPSAHK